MLTVHGIVIRYKAYTEQHPRAGLKIQHVIYEQPARAGQITQPTNVHVKTILDQNDPCKLSIATSIPCKWCPSGLSHHISNSSRDTG